MKCRDCGIGALPPKYQVSAQGYAAAVPVGLMLSAVAGALALWIPFFLLLFFIAPVCGGVIAEAMAYASGRKRGPRLAVAAAATVAVGSLCGGILYSLARAGGAFLTFGLGTFVLSGVLFSGLSAVAAYWRLR